MKLNRHILLLGIIALYIIKVIVLGIYEFKILDILVFVTIISALVVEVYNYCKNKLTVDNRKLHIFTAIIFGVVIYVLLVNSSYITSATTVGDANKTNGLPWNIVNEFDSGSNSEILNKDTLKNNKNTIVPKQYISEEIIDGDGYYIPIANNSFITNVTNIDDEDIVVSSYLEEHDIEHDAVKLSFDNNERRFISATTYSNEKIYAISRLDSLSSHYMLSIHSSDGSFIESVNYVWDEYYEMRFSAFVEGDNEKLYLFAGDYNKVDVIEIDETFNYRVLQTFDQSYVKNGAVFSDYILVVNKLDLNSSSRNDLYRINNANYEIIKMSLDGKIIDKSECVVPYTNYASKTLNIDINKDGNTYVIRDLKVGVTEKLTSSDASNIEDETKYVAIDIYNNELDRIDSIYFHKKEMGDYELFFQVKKENDNYVIYSNRDVITVSPIDKNKWAAAIFVTLCLWTLLLCFTITTRFLNYILDKVSVKK